MHISEPADIKTHLKKKAKDALDAKYVELCGYIDDMVDTADGQTPAECGLDPEFNIDEFIKELKELI